MIGVGLIFTVAPHVAFGELVKLELRKRLVGFPSIPPLTCMPKAGSPQNWSATTIRPTRNSKKLSNNFCA